MSGINLKDTEIPLFHVVKDNLDKLRKDIRNGQKLSHEERETLYKGMATAAHQLHMSLTNRGFEPVHHKYMIKNRGMEANHPEFYDHIHPVEDLLAFLEDVESNKDPEDQTVGKKFNFEVFTRRWGHKDRYEIRRTEHGWYFEGNTYHGECEKSGHPVLFKALEHDSVNYPEALGGYLEWVWDRAKEDGLSEEEVQEALNQLSGWVSLTEKHSPLGIFQGYK